MEILLFELYRRNVAAIGMATFRVVEHLDVIEHIRPCFVTVSIDTALNALTFQELEEALFCHSIVVAVAGWDSARLFFGHL